MVITREGHGSDWEWIIGYWVWDSGWLGLGGLVCWCVLGALVDMCRVAWKPGLS